MKAFKIIVGYLILQMVSISAVAQDASLFRGTFLIGPNTDLGSNQYQVFASFTDLSGQYTGADMQPGDIAFDLNCNQYRVISISLPVTFVLEDINGAGPPSGGLGSVIRPTTNKSYPLFVPGIPETLQSCIQSKFIVLLDGDVNNGGGTGVPGAGILNGEGTPSGALGSIGEFYINTLTNDIYGPKTEVSGWGDPVSLIGPAGEDGGSVQIQGSLNNTGELPTPDGGNIGHGYLIGTHLWVSDGTQWIDVGPVRGPKGDIGDQGPQGAQGPQGERGADGTAITTKEAVNTADDLPTTGNTAGDLRITLDDLHGHVWDGTQWVDIGPIQGPQGKQGPIGPQGIQGPQGADGTAFNFTGSGPLPDPDTYDGNIGDTWIDESGNGWVWNGTLWVSLGEVRGPQGPQGPMGPQGQDGADGKDGSAITTKGTVDGPENLPTTGNTIGDTYIDTNTLDAYVWDGTKWVNIGPFQGPQGDAGPQGAQGPQGPQGNEGPQGEVGPTGPTGSDGSSIAITAYVETTDALPDPSTVPDQAFYIVGTVTDGGEHDGETGVGYVESNDTWLYMGGMRGPQGDAGPQGAQGAQGPIGSQGPIGPQGEQGIQGNNGTALNTAGTGPLPDPTTYSGATGDLWIDENGTGHVFDASGPSWTQIGPIQGPTGAQGPMGAQGPQGVAGRDGSAIRFLGSVATEADLLAISSPNIGDTYAALDTGFGHVWDGSTWISIGPFVGPQGEQGAQGAQGIQGPKGDKGDTGAPGTTGQNAVAVNIKGSVLNVSARDALTGLEANDGYFVGNDGSPATYQLHVWDGTQWVVTDALPGPQGEAAPEIVQFIIADGITSYNGAGTPPEGHLVVKFDNDLHYDAGNAKGDTGPAGNAFNILGSVTITDLEGLTGTNPGDAYIITDSNNEIYVWDGTMWQATQATQGPSGNSIHNGSGAPTDNGLGQDGDFYLDTDTYTMYGPKAAGTWPGSGTVLSSGGALSNITTYSAGNGAIVTASGPQIISYSVSGGIGTLTVPAGSGIQLHSIRIKGATADINNGDFKIVIDYLGGYAETGQNNSYQQDFYPPTIQLLDMTNVNFGFGNSDDAGFSYDDSNNPKKRITSVSDGDITLLIQNIDAFANWMISIDMF